MRKLTSALPLFSLNRQELFEFDRCPKIVSIRAYRLLNPVVKEHPIIRAVPEVKASIIGRMGEAAAKAAFSEDADEADTEEELVAILAKQTTRAVSDLGAELDTATKRILVETVKGMAEVKGYVASQYGEVRVIGRGVCKNGPFPGEALPDLVALSPGKRQPILIEVKNSSKPAKTDRFQAAFYNTIARQTGVVVHEQRMQEGKLNLEPVAYHDSIADTLLVYPRGRSFEKVSEKVDVSDKKLEEVWSAKQLGYSGRSPHTDCDAGCAHHRLGIELPEGNIEAATPVPLVYAKGLTEVGYDLDSDYLHRFFFNSGLSTGIFDTVFFARDDPLKRKEIVGRIATKTGIPEETVRKMAYPDQRFPDTAKVVKTMSDEFDPWKKILGKQAKSKIESSYVKGLVSRFYTLPDKSEPFVRRAWDKWER